MARKKRGPVCCILLKLCTQHSFSAFSSSVLSSLSGFSRPLSPSLSLSGLSQLHCISSALESHKRCHCVCVCVLCALLSVVVLSHEEVICYISVNRLRCTLILSPDCCEFLGQVHSHHCEVFTCFIMCNVSLSGRDPWAGCLKYT